MHEPWFILTKRFGTDVHGPSTQVLRDAVNEVADPAYSHDAEHTSAFLRYGFADGPMYVVSYDTAGCLTFEQWADQDFESELAPAGYLYDVLPAAAAQIMEDLAAGNIDTVKSRGWSGGR